MASRFIDRNWRGSSRLTNDHEKMALVCDRACSFIHLMMVFCDTFRLSCDIVIVQLIITWRTSPI